MPTTTEAYTTIPGSLSGPLSMRGSGASSFYLSDYHGTTRQFADSTQTVTDALLTDAWGKEITSTGTTVNPYKAMGVEVLPGGKSRVRESQAPSERR